MTAEEGAEFVADLRAREAMDKLNPEERATAALASDIRRVSPQQCEGGLKNDAAYWSTAPEPEKKSELERRTAAVRSSALCYRVPLADLFDACLQATPVCLWLVAHKQKRLEGRAREELYKSPYYFFAAGVYFTHWRQTIDPWAAVRASRSYRRAQEPASAVRIVKEALLVRALFGRRVESALLTTQAGAFKDLGQLPEAWKAAQEAINVDDRAQHPYCVLAAICAMQGNRGGADYYFLEAIKRCAELDSLRSEYAGFDKEYAARLAALAELWRKNDREKNGHDN